MSPMKLAELLKPWFLNNCPDITISGLNNDSRQITSNCAFLAYPGAQFDGRNYIKQALEAGANAVIYDPISWSIDESICSNQVMIPVPDLVSHLAMIASRFYHHPARQLAITGITGTNGKTTIAYQLAQAHELLSNPSAYVGTLGFGAPANLQPLVNTTPDALCLQTILANFLTQGIKQINMEVSSHALDQKRVDAIEFQQAIFTNLTQDHLDYHVTMEAYAMAKSKLFQKHSLKWAIVNYDDNYASLMTKNIDKYCQCITYGRKEGSDVRVVDWQVNLKGTSIYVESPWGNHQLTLNALGFFNIYNALAIFTSLLAYGYEVSKVVAVMSKLKSSPGRMEIVNHQPYMIVDYAHTPDALENVLKTLSSVKKGKIILVFGCGGDRDKTKRPLMGTIAAKNADIIIITSDNPRTEDPESIIQDIKQGLPNTTSCHIIVNRKEAIAQAINLAEKKDIILVAGKGHEAYQQIGNIKHPFSDQDVLRELSTASN